MTKRKTQKKKLSQKDFSEMLNILLPIKTKEETPKQINQQRKETLRIP